MNELVTDGDSKLIFHSSCKQDIKRYRLHNISAILRAIKRNYDNHRSKETFSVTSSNSTSRGILWRRCFDRDVVPAALIESYCHQKKLFNGVSIDVYTSD
jgi:hypothetical protein